MTDKVNSVYAKLVKCGLSLQYLVKDGNVKGLNYRYSSAAKILIEVRKVFLENSLIALIVEEEVNNFESKKPMIALRMTIRITDAETGDHVDVKATGDQSQLCDGKGVHICRTTAHKYALVKMLLLPTLDDKDVEKVEHENGIRKAARMAEELTPHMMEKIKEKGWETAWNGFSKDEKIVAKNCQRVKDLVKSLAECEASLEEHNDDNNE